MKETIEELEAWLSQLENTTDEEVWWTALMEMRGVAARAIQQLADRRFAAARAQGLNVFGKPLTTKSPRRTYLPVSTLEDMLNDDTPTAVHSNDRPSGLG